MLEGRGGSEGQGGSFAARSGGVAPIFADTAATASVAGCVAVGMDAEGAEGAATAPSWWEGGGAYATRGGAPGTRRGGTDGGIGRGGAKASSGVGGCAAAAGSCSVAS